LYLHGFLGSVLGGNHTIIVLAIACHKSRSRPNRKVCFSRSKNRNNTLYKYPLFCFFIEVLYRHPYHLTHASACSEGEIKYSLYQRRNHPCCSAPQLHLVSDAMTGALLAAVCEVFAVAHYQRQRMMESIDRVRLYQQFRNTMMLIVSSLDTALPLLFTFHY
jgi:hypothetical protein